MILAGGTGGHVYPALAVARELIERGCEVRWMGTPAGLEARVVPAAGIVMEGLSVSGFRGKGWVSKLAAPYRLLLALGQAWRILLRFRPNVVLGVGGFVSGPGGVVARWLGIPLVIHEQNRVPGTTNRILVKWANKVLEAFPGSFPRSVGALCVGNPLRREIVEAAATGKPASGGVIRILVLGGSQGARALNQIVPEALALLGAGGVDVLHQTGSVLHAETASCYRERGIKADVRVFIDDMAAAYRWADLAICRAGAMTLSELTASGLPAVLIPFPYAIDDHQTQNARYLSEAGAAVLLPQSELTPQYLANRLRTLLETQGLLADMARRASALAKTDAARRVADLCLDEAAQ